MVVAPSSDLNGYVTLSASPAAPAALDGEPAEVGAVAPAEVVRRALRPVGRQASTKLAAEPAPGKAMPPSAQIRGQLRGSIQPCGEITPE